MRSSKYTEHYTDTFITFKEIMRTVSNIYHNCVPDKIKKVQYKFLCKRL
ncbi:transposase [Enterococcus sp. DIV0733a]